MLTLKTRKAKPKSLESEIYIRGSIEDGEQKIINLPTLSALKVVDEIEFCLFALEYRITGELLKSFSF